MTHGPAGFEHGRIVSRIFSRLNSYVTSQNLGVVVGAETGMLIGSAPPQVCSADVAFICTARVPPQPIVGPFPAAPDLAVEVLAPNDRAADALNKVQQWLQGGCRAVWLVDPATRSATVHRSGTPSATLHEHDEFDGEEIVPGLRFLVKDVFGP